MCSLPEYPHGLMPNSPVAQPGPGPPRRTQGRQSRVCPAPDSFLSQGRECIGMSKRRIPKFSRKYHCPRLVDIAAAYLAHTNQTWDLSCLTQEAREMVASHRVERDYLWTVHRPDCKRVSVFKSCGCPTAHYCENPNCPMWHPK